MGHETDLPAGRLEVGSANLIYRCLQRGLHPPEDEVWVEIRLDAEWVAACLIEPEDGKPVIAELRVLPYEDDLERNVLRGPGDWSRPGIPPGGVPLEKLRSLRTEQILQSIQDRIDAWPNEVEYLNDLLADFGLDG